MMHKTIVVNRLDRKGKEKPPLIKCKFCEYKSVCQKYKKSIFAKIFGCKYFVNGFKL